MLPEFYQRYVDNFQGPSVPTGMLLAGDQALDFYKSLSAEEFELRYAPEKWSIKEILGHVIDGERIFAYRALRFARSDSTELPGFDENLYVPKMNINQRTTIGLINEFANLRASSIDLWSGFTMEMNQLRGKASDIEFTVEEIGKILVGHEVHHRKVIMDRYLMQ